MERVTLPIDFRLADKHRRTLGSIPVNRESNVRAWRGPINERVTGIEPAWPAWKAGALPLSYTREPQHKLQRDNTTSNQMVLDFSLPVFGN